MSDAGLGQLVTSIFGAGSALHGTGTSSGKTGTKGITVNKGVTNTNTSTNSQGVDINKQNTVNSSTQKQTDNTSTNQNVTGSTTGNQTNTTVGTADAGALAASRNIASTALRDSTDPSKTTALVNEVLNKAAVQFGQTQGGAERQAGLYDSSTQKLLTGYAEGQATADAASTVLNYQQGEQSIASGAESNILAATKGSTGTTSDNSTNQQGTTSQSISNLINTLSGITKSGSINTTDQNTSSNSKTGTINRTGTDSITNTANQSHQDSSGDQGGILSELSVVCTELHNQGLLDTRVYMITMHHFREYSWISKEAYFSWAIPATKYFRSNPDSLFSRKLRMLTERRCFYIAHCIRPHVYPLEIKNLLSYLIIQGICLGTGLFYLLPKLGLHWIKDKFSADRSLIND